MKHYEEKLKREKKYQGHLVDVYVDEILIHDNNEQALREVVNHSGGVCVAARTKDNKFLLVKQYRYAQQEVGLEFIAGKKEKGEDPFLGIQRELHEEGGVTALTWIELGESFPSPAYLNEKIHLYYADGLVEVGQHLDENEFIELYDYTLDEIIELIEDNEIKDLKTIALTYRLKHELNKVQHQTIKTKRLELVPINDDFIEPINKHFKEDIITYLFPTVHKDLSETRSVVSNMIKQRFKGTDYIYAITKDNEFLGLCGLHSIKSDKQELGIWLKKEAHQHHYGREAIQALIDLSKELELKTLIYPVDHRNTSSVKLIKHLGGQLTDDIEKVTTSDNRDLEIVTYKIQLSID